MSIVVENISKKYGKQDALKNVSFSIKKGEIVGFLGPNGAGKSTLMKILTTYISADKGTALVNNYNVVTQTKKVQQSVGYLPEHNPLYLDLYVKEYLNFNATIYNVSKKRVATVMALTGLEKEANKKIETLSKGYRQRVGLACALLHNPEVLILDEPTTGLDPNQLIEIRNLIRNIGKDKTVFLSTHIMQEVEAICDRVIIINKGQVVEDKPLTNLTKNETSQLIEVEFTTEVSEEILLFSHLVSKEKVSKTKWLLTFNTTEDKRSDVFDFAQQHQLKIVQLNAKDKKLEDIFIEKTS